MKKYIALSYFLIGLLLGAHVGVYESLAKLTDISMVLYLKIPLIIVMSSMGFAFIGRAFVLAVELSNRITEWRKEDEI